MKSKEKLTAAHELLQNNKPSQSIEQFKQILLEEHMNTEAYEGIIKACLLTDVDQAFEWVKKADDNNCLSDLVRLTFGSALVRCHRYTEAKPYLIKAGESTELIDLGKCIAYLFLVIIYIDAFCGEDHNPLEKKIAVERAIRFAQLAEALTDDKSLLETINYILGHCFQRKRDYINAISKFEKVLELDSFDSDALYYRGYCLNELGRFFDAIESYNESIKLTGYYGSYFAKGVIFFRSHFYEEAIKSWQPILKMDIPYIVNNSKRPSRYQYKYAIYLFLGVAWSKLIEHSKALDCFRAAITVNPNDTMGHSLYAALLFRLKHFEMALKAQKLAVQLIERRPQDYNDDDHIKNFIVYAQMLHSVSERKFQYKDLVSRYIGDALQKFKNFVPGSSWKTDKFENLKATAEQLFLFYEGKFFSDNQKYAMLNQITEKYNYHETDVHLASRNSDISRLNSLPDTTNMDALNQRLESALILAVQNKSLLFISALVDRGASISLAGLCYGKDGTVDYKTPLDIAVEQALKDLNDMNQWAIVEYLLLNREKFSHKHLDFVLKFIVSSQLNGTTEMIRSIFNFAINCLVHENILGVITQDHISQYLGHIMDRGGQIKELQYKNGKKLTTLFDLENWNPEAFFMLRVYSYINIFAQLTNEKKVSKNEDQDEDAYSASYYNDRLIKSLLLEILILLEMLRCMRDGILVDRILNAPGISIDVKSKVRLAYINNMKNKILNLNNGDVFVFYSGVYGGHGLYVNFSYDVTNKLIQRRVDNLGESSHLHFQQNGKIWPCQLPSLNKDQVAGYLVNLYTARITPANRFMFWRNNYSLIYDDKKAKPDDYTPAHPPQSVANCIVKNKNIGEEIRMGCFPYQHLQEKEREFVQSLDRLNKRIIEEQFDNAVGTIAHMTEEKFPLLTTTNALRAKL